MKSSEERMPLNFASFVSSLGMQALLHMGDIPHPVTQKKEENLDAASEIIDIIGILEDKTKGNLTKEEADFITRLLHDLRIQYVEKGK
ncbi:MAG: DUF1844 domain-containing protein [Candidatus Omnitrophica bacterium]|nr:DUF1844 domain-containing protein [Candidatus Omnitrophota bacterium]